MKETTSQRLKYIMRELNLKQVDVIEKSKAYQKELGVSLGKSALSQLMIINIKRTILSYRSFFLSSIKIILYF